MVQILEFIRSPDVSFILISLLASLAVLLGIYGIYKERAYRQLQQRLHEVSGGTVVAEPVDSEGSFSDRVLKPISRVALAKLGRYTPSGNIELLRKQLRMAGNPGNIAVIDFLGLKMLAAIVVSALSAGYVMSGAEPNLSKIMLYGVGGAVFGLFVPNFWLGSKIQKRKNEINKSLPNALDMLTTMVDAGLGFDIALLRLCEKWDNPLTHEFERVVHEMRMGVRKVEALRNMADRVDVPELSTFIAVLIQADQLGISVGNILHTQSEQIRMRRRQWVEESAAKMPLKMMPIIVFFIFPALFAVLLGPALPSMLEAFGGL